MSELEETKLKKIHSIDRLPIADTCRASASRCRPMAFKLPGPEPAQTLEGHEGAVLSLSLGCNWYLYYMFPALTWLANGMHSARAGVH